MRVLVAGNWEYPIYAPAVARALEELGHEPIRFQYWQNSKPEGLLQRAQNRFLLGPAVRKINDRLKQKVEEASPDVVFVFRGAHVLPSTLRHLQDAHPEVTLVNYNNDNPFSQDQRSWYWRHFLKGIPHYDLCLAYREENIEDLRDAGAQQTSLLRSWFLPWLHRPMKAEGPESNPFAHDVVFVGHYEDDGRLQTLEELATTDIDLGLYGTRWDEAISSDSPLAEEMPVRRLDGEDYAKGLSGAKIALGFLSELNRDPYTRRNFEIPACGTMMLAERTDTLAEMFRPGKDADFFGSTDELLEKVQHYIDHPDERENIASSGRRRVVEDGHDVVSRIDETMNMIREFRS